MRRVVVATLTSSLAVSFAAGALQSQIVETPIPFDSARRVLAITPRMAERLRLVAPVWPVATPTFREARLYSVQPPSGFVLVVQRETGTFERYPLTESARSALGSAIDAATVASGRPSGELSSDVVSEPAGNAFARHQTLVGAAVYGPLAASLATDGSVAGALYLATTGLSFFLSYSASQSAPFTRAQTDLAQSLGLSAATGGWLIAYSLGGNSDRGVRAVSLASGVAGTVAGVALGTSLTDAEAHAAAFGIENGAAVGLLGALAANADPRTLAAAATAGGALGLPIGIAYPRHAAYNVTAGDIEVTSTASLVGTLATAALLGEGNQSRRKVMAILSGGYLAGGLIGDRALARPFDFTRSQATLVNVGAIAGAVIGAAVPVLAKQSNRLLDFGAPAAGAVLGMATIVSSFPNDASTRVGASRAGPSRVRFVVDPTALVAAAGGVQGSHVLARFTF
jgi:hypothetical protein